MSIENTISGSTEVNAQTLNLAKRKTELLDEENNLLKEKAKIAQERNQEIRDLRENKERDLVSISREAEKQAEQFRKINTDRLQNSNQLSTKNYEELAAKTADHLRVFNEEAKRIIADTRRKNMDSLAFIEKQAEDPFYRVKSFQPSVHENDSAFTIKVNLPEHEAKNLMVTGNKQTVKLALARRFQETATNPETANSTRTDSYQTILETVNLPADIDEKGIKKDFADGVVTIQVPKHKPQKFVK